MSDVVPFPLIRRRDYVRRIARRVADAPTATANKILAHALQVQVDTMTRRRIDPSQIAIEIRALEAFIQREIWRLTVVEGGAA